MTYNKQILYPPRPEQAVHPKYLADYDNGTYMAEPKLNGDCAVLYLNGTESFVRDRHREPFRKNLNGLDKIAADLAAHCGQGWTVLVGEWMTKAKRDGLDQNFNGNLVLFDIIVHHSEHLLKYTFEERLSLLQTLLPNEQQGARFIRQSIPNVWLVNAFYDDFASLFDSIEADMYEGLVLKRRDAKLELGLTERTNNRSQLKFRKAAKNYHY